MAGGRDFEGRDEVALGVGAVGPHRHLRPREHHRLAQVLENVAERGRRVGHGVGAVQHHEAVEVGVVPADEPGQKQPVGRRHVAAVDGFGQAEQFEAEGQAGELGHLAVEPAELHGHQVAGAAQGHAHGAAGVDDEQARGRGVGRVGAGGQGQQRQVDIGHGRAGIGPQVGQEFSSAVARSLCCGAVERCLNRGFGVVQR